MLAAVVRGGAAPRVVELMRVPTPAPGPDEVLIRVEACGMNRSDLHLLHGRMPNAAVGDVIGGSEIVGEVVGHGTPGVGPPLGARVFCDSNRSCRVCRECRRGHENLCRNAQIAGVAVDGGLAEFASVPVWTLTELPSALTWETGAAVALAGMTSWHMIHTRAATKPGETVLVLSASGAVGSLAVQVARNAGAFVIATTSTPRKQVQIAGLGARLVLDHRSGDVRAKVLEATSGAGADVVVEHVGGASLALALRCAARGARVVTCGATAGSEAVVDLWRLFSKEISLIGCVGATREETQAVLADAASGALKPVIALVVPLEDVAAAYAALADADRVGKVVVRV
jgi:NADPH:quinone reductase-like Zn-dependent oxidoreductase